MDNNTYSTICRYSFNALGSALGKDRIVEYSRKNTSKELSSAINFTGMGLEPWEVLSFSVLCSALSLIVIIALGCLAFSLSMLDGNTFTLFILCAGILPLIIFFYMCGYPKRKAAYMKIHSLGDIPEVVSYIVMSMKLNPNMEMALMFAASNSKRQLARDVNKLLWDLQVRLYDSIDDALVAFAGEWGQYSEHFKRSMFIIKSSTCEKDEAMRTISLNRALDVVLAGTKGLMEKFSGSLHSPTLILYSIFVMVPLAMVAMLPAAAVIGIRINTMQLVLLYDIVFPLITLAYAQSILISRPAAFAPPVIPANAVKNFLSKKAIVIISALSGIAVASLYFFTGNIILPMPSTIFFVIGAAVSISVYCILAYEPYKKIRDEIISMESEFADSLFVLGRRISEGRSPEDAFSYTAGVVSGTAIGRAYSRASFNIRCLRTTLFDAVLDPKYGGFSDIYSDRIKATMCMLIESSGKSGEVAGNSVIRLADHLKELQAIEDEIRKLLLTMTSMLRATCTIFAPFIAGITLALSEAVTGVVLKTLEDMKEMPEAAREYFPMVPEFSAPLITPEEFVLIVGIYVLLLVIILLKFVDGIEHGDDRYEFMYSLGRTLPVSMAVFVMTTIISGILFQGML
jgi:hypothetical protein